MLLSAIQLKNETAAETGISGSHNMHANNKTATAATTPPSTDILSQSLSSAFFKKPKHDVNAPPPPPPPPTTSTGSSTDASASVNINHNYQQQQLSQPVSDIQALDLKRKETAAAVSQMKERLKKMGILNKTGTITTTSDHNTSNHHNDSSKSTVKVHQLLPPVPPSPNTEHAQNTKKNVTLTGKSDDYDTMNDELITNNNSNDKSSANSVAGGSAVTEYDNVKKLVTQLKRKSVKYQDILRCVLGMLLMLLVLLLLICYIVL